jgi:5-methylcytosine-specific restriction endonuclease McrA
MGKNKNKIHRFKVYDKYNYSCAYCNRFFAVPNNWNKKDAIHDGFMWLEIDHIVPLSKGGSDNLDNKQALCQKCNNFKSDKL